MDEKQPRTFRVRFEIEVNGKRHIDIDPEEMRFVDLDRIASLLRESIEVRLVPNYEDLALALGGFAPGDDQQLDNKQPNKAHRCAELWNEHNKENSTG